jgi:hypothetical protein
MHPPIELNPEKHARLPMRAEVYGQKQDYVKAETDWDQGDQNDSLSAEAFFNRGIARLRQGKADTAVEDFIRTN